MIDEYLESILQALVTNSVITSFNVIRQEAGEDDGYVRIKSFLSNDGTLEFSEYIEVSKDKVSVITYSYHWQDSKGRLMKRWDNVAHHKELNTFPHHLHLHTGEVIKSKPMTLKKVLKEIEKVLLIKHHEE